MSPPTQIYPFHPGKSLLLVCTDRLTNPSWSFTWFLNSVEMNNTGLSHAVYNYDRKSYLNFQNLTKIIMDRLNHDNTRGDFGANFTCQAKGTYSGQAKNTSAFIRKCQYKVYENIHCAHRYRSSFAHEILRILLVSLVIFNQMQ